MSLYRNDRSFSGNIGLSLRRCQSMIRPGAVYRSRLAGLWWSPPTHPTSLWGRGAVGLAWARCAAGPRKLVDLKRPLATTGFRSAGTVCPSIQMGRRTVNSLLLDVASSVSVKPRRWLPKAPKRWPLLCVVHAIGTKRVSKSVTVGRPRGWPTSGVGLAGCPAVTSGSHSDPSPSTRDKSLVVACDGGSAPTGSR